jgi:chromosome segregation ATPase
MTSESSNEQRGKLSLEIRKLEVRLAEFLEHEDDFVAKLQGFLEQLKGLQESINNAETSLDSEKFKELMKLKIEVADAFNEALRKASKAEHEKSHLLESYGALISSLEYEFQRLCSNVLGQQ